MYLKHLDLIENQVKQAREVDTFEQINFRLPPIYKSFVTTYDIHTEVTEKFRFFNPESESLNSFYDAYFKNNEDIIIHRLFDLQTCLEFKKIVYGDSPKFKKWLPIGECAFQIYILLGIGAENIDEIYFESELEDPNITFLAPHIYSFLSNYQVMPDEESLPEGTQLRHLSKNWDEDFWRIAIE